MTSDSDGEIEAMTSLVLQVPPIVREDTDLDEMLQATTGAFELKHTRGKEVRRAAPLPAIPQERATKALPPEYHASHVFTPKPSAAGENMMSPSETSLRMEDRVLEEPLKAVEVVANRARHVVVHDASKAALVTEIRELNAERRRLEESIRRQKALLFGPAPPRRRPPPPSR